MVIIASRKSPVVHAAGADKRPLCGKKLGGTGWRAYPTLNELVAVSCPTCLASLKGV